MFTYAIRESVSVPNHFTIAYRDDDGQLIPLLNSKATPMLFRSVDHATKYITAYCGGAIEQEG